MPPLRCCLNAPAPATLFVQLSMRRQAATTTTTLPPILDLLVPPRRRAIHTGIMVPRRITWKPQASSSSSSSLSQRRTFVCTPSNRATHTIYNPQHDEDGKEMRLEITPRAGKRLSEIMSKDGNPFLALRIQVESGGCHGFQYLMKLVTLPSSLPSPNTNNNNDNNTTNITNSNAQDNDGGSAINEDDTIFSYLPDDGTTATTQPNLTAPKIILDGPSLDLLKGSKVDFTMELIGSQFKIVDNPLATSSCGCGTSFDIKI